MNIFSETDKCLLALSSVEELALKKKQTLLKSVGDPAELTNARRKVTDVLGAEHAAAFWDALDGIDGLIEKLNREEVRFISYLDDDYPSSLRELEDAPVGLFAKGDMGALKHDLIGIVGTRHPTRYGSKVAEEFAKEFALAGVTIVSGFARGVDIISHKACMAQGAPTVAVWGSGLDVCYPAEHRGYADALTQSGGLLLSEYPLGAKPLQYHFPERNRIISGLSRAVFLAEAAAKSGSLITMRLAIEQGKDVFTVPGNIYAAECEGNNNLLREIPHALVISPEDVLDALRISREVSVKEPVELSIMENIIVEELRHGEKHFEELLAATDLTVGELTNTLFALEMNGIVENIGSNYYDLA